MIKSVAVADTLNKKILVAMSGGVDSSVAAALLVEEGYEVAGATIKTWASNTCVSRNTRACCGLTGVEDAREVADALGIRYWVFNFEEEFKKHVVDYFASEYRAGRTPNPCIACNEHIKFRLFLKRARQLGFEAIATGHYARLASEGTGTFKGTGKNGCPPKGACPLYWIEEGVDERKDQSYVLFPLDQDVLSHLYLPLGRFRKTEIRAKARELGLTPVMEKPDSQEICFIPSNDYPEFLEREFEFKKSPGTIRRRDGKILGTHDGYHRYTRGQRRGLGVAYAERLYVLETIPETNEVVVGTKDELPDQTFVVERINWMIPPQKVPVPKRCLSPKGACPLRAHVKIRSQHQRAAANVEILGENSVRVTFDEPEEAATPGQAAVFYDGPRLLGGGWIASPGTGSNGDTFT